MNRWAAPRTPEEQRSRAGASDLFHALAITRDGDVREQIEVVASGLPTPISM